MCVCKCVISKSGGRGGLPEKVTFEWRCEAGEGASAAASRAVPVVFQDHLEGQWGWREPGGGQGGAPDGAGSCGPL